jgi:hypothetical protein
MKKRHSKKDRTNTCGCAAAVAATAVVAAT